MLFTYLRVAVRAAFLPAWALTCLATPANAHVALLAPNGGETLAAGSTFTIRWQIVIGHSTQNWDLWYSTTGPNGPWIPIAMDLPAGNTVTGAFHSYQWTVPNTPSTSVRVRVRQDNARIDYYDISDGDLTITSAPASYTPFGQGCAGSAGVPALAAAPNSLPITGTTFSALLTNLPNASSGAFLVAGGGQTPPTSLSPFGLGGCQSFVTFDSVSFVPVTNGTGTWTVAVPNRASLISLEFFHQALVLDPSAPNPAGAVVTNAAHAVLSDH